MNLVFSYKHVTVKIRRTGKIKERVNENEVKNQTLQLLLEDLYTKMMNKMQVGLII